MGFNAPVVFDGVTLSFREPLNGSIELRRLDTAKGDETIVGLRGHFRYESWKRG